MNELDLWTSSYVEDLEKEVREVSFFLNHRRLLPSAVIEKLEKLKHILTQTTSLINHDSSGISKYCLVERTQGTDLPNSLSKFHYIPPLLIRKTQRNFNTDVKSFNDFLEEIKSDISDLIFSEDFSESHILDLEMKVKSDLIRKSGNNFNNSEFTRNWVKEMHKNYSGAREKAYDVKQFLEQVRHARQHKLFFDRFGLSSFNLDAILFNESPEFIRTLSERAQLDFSKAKSFEGVSFNSVTIMYSPETEKMYVVKMTDSATNAQKELVNANVKCSTLAPVIHSVPFSLDSGLYVTIQEFVSLNEPFAMKTFMKSLAECHFYLTECSFVKDYDPRIMSTEQVKEMLGWRTDVPLGELLPRFEVARAMLLGDLHTIPRTVCHSDLKRDNYGVRHIIDWENFCTSNPAQDVVFPLIQNNIPIDQWRSAVTPYLNRLCELNPHMGAAVGEKLYEDLVKYALIPITMELCGLYSRTIGRGQQNQIEQIENFMKQYFKLSSSQSGL